MEITHWAVLTLCFRLVSSLSVGRSDFPSRERYSFFDTELFKVISQDEAENVIISPVSVKLLLGMLLEGASGLTGEEIRLALRLPKDKEATRKEFHIWLSLIQAVDPSSELHMATQVFLSERYLLNPPYKSILEKYYGTGISTVKFDEPKEASRFINKWAGAQTSGLIPKVVTDSSIAPDTKLLLMSAVYFKGFWSVPFARENGRFRCFYKLDGTCAVTRMMSDTGHYKYGYVNRLDAKALQVPYKGGKYFMLILLPSQGDKIDELSRDLVHVSTSSILSELESQEVFVQIPKFEIKYEHDLVESLKKLRLSAMFNAGANFSNILLSGSDPMEVHHVIHSARIAVDEEGSEAAAATDAMFVPLMGGTTTSFIANHPFLFFIMASFTNSIIFAGKLTVPSHSEDVSTSLPSHVPDFSKDTVNQPTVSPQPSSTVSSTINGQSVEDSSDVPDAPAKVTRRGSPQSPKFRSIKGAFSQQKLSYPGLTPLRPNFYYSTGDLDGSSSAGKFKPTSMDDAELPVFVDEVASRPAIQETQKPVKRNPGPDTWRHHILFFT